MLVVCMLSAKPVHAACENGQYDGSQDRAFLSAVIGDNIEISQIELGVDDDNTLFEPIDVVKIPGCDDEVAGGFMERALQELGVSDDTAAGRARIAEYENTSGGSSDFELWCSDFVNYILTESDIEPSGSSLAKSFLDWGVSVGKNPQPGAICVFNRGDNPTSGHVGFFVGYGPGGGMNILGGNQGAGGGARGVTISERNPTAPGRELVDCRMPTNGDAGIQCVGGQGTKENELIEGGHGSPGLEDESRDLADYVYPHRDKLPPGMRQKYEEAAKRASDTLGVYINPDVAMAMADKESDHRVGFKQEGGPAIGLCQLEPAGASGYGPQLKSEYRGRFGSAVDSDEFLQCALIVHDRMDEFSNYRHTFRDNIPLSAPDILALHNWGAGQVGGKTGYWAFRKYFEQHPNGLPPRNSSYDYNTVGAAHRFFQDAGFADAKIYRNWTGFSESGSPQMMQGATNWEEVKAGILSFAENYSGGGSTGAGSGGDGNFPEHGRRNSAEAGIDIVIQKPVKYLALLTDSIVSNANNPQVGGQGNPYVTRSKQIISTVIAMAMDAFNSTMFEIYCRLAEDYKPVVQALLILYIVLYGLGYLTNMVQRSWGEMVLRLIKVTFIYYLATNSDTFYNYMYGIIMEFIRFGSCLVLSFDVPSGAATTSAVFGEGTDIAGSCGAGGIFTKFDMLFHMAIGMDTEFGPLVLLGGLALAISLSKISFVGWIVLVLAFFGILTSIFAFLRILVTFVSSILFLSFQLLWAPIFIPFLLFKQTDDMGWRWLAAIISNAIQPILVLIFLGLVALTINYQRLFETLGKNVDEVVVGDQFLQENINQLGRDVMNGLRSAIDKGPEAFVDAVQDAIRSGTDIGEAFLGGSGLRDNVSKAIDRFIPNNVELLNTGVDLDITPIKNELIRLAEDPNINDESLIKFLGGLEDGTISYDDITGENGLISEDRFNDLIKSTVDAQNVDEIERRIEELESQGASLGDVNALKAARLALISAQTSLGSSLAGTLAKNILNRQNADGTTGFQFMELLEAITDGKTIDTTAIMKTISEDAAEFLKLLNRIPLVRYVRKESSDHGSLSLQDYWCNADKTVTCGDVVHERIWVIMLWLLTNLLLTLFPIGEIARYLSRLNTRVASYVVPIYEDVFSGRMGELNITNKGGVLRPGQLSGRVGKGNFISLGDLYSDAAYVGGVAYEPFGIFLDKVGISRGVQRNALNVGVSAFIGSKLAGMVGGDKAIVARRADGIREQFAQRGLVAERADLLTVSRLELATDVEVKRMAKEIMKQNKDSFDGVDEAQVDEWSDKQVQDFQKHMVALKRAGVSEKVLRQQAYAEVAKLRDEQRAELQQDKDGARRSQLGTMSEQEYAKLIDDQIKIQEAEIETEKAKSAVERFMHVNTEAADAAGRQMQIHTAEGRLNAAEKELLSAGLNRDAEIEAQKLRLQGQEIEEQKLAEIQEAVMRQYRQEVQAVIAERAKEGEVIDNKKAAEIVEKRRYEKAEHQIQELKKQLNETDKTNHIAIKSINDAISSIESQQAGYTSSQVALQQAQDNLWKREEEDKKAYNSASESEKVRIDQARVTAKTAMAVQSNADSIVVNQSIFDKFEANDIWQASTSATSSGHDMWGNTEEERSMWNTMESGFDPSERLAETARIVAEDQARAAQQALEAVENKPSSTAKKDTPKKSSDLGGAYGGINGMQGYDPISLEPEGKVQVDLDKGLDSPQNAIEQAKDDVVAKALYSSAVDKSAEGFGATLDKYFAGKSKEAAAQKSMAQELVAKVQAKLKSGERMTADDIRQMTQEEINESLDMSEGKIKLDINKMESAIMEFVGKNITGDLK